MRNPRWIALTTIAVAMLAAPAATAQGKGGDKGAGEAAHKAGKAAGESARAAGAAARAAGKAARDEAAAARAGAKGAAKRAEHEAKKAEQAAKKAEHAGKGAAMKAEHASETGKAHSAKDDAGADADAGTRAEIKAKLKALRDKHAASRDERRKAARANAKAKWGAVLADKLAQHEMEVHARRVARIDAIEQAAKAAGKDHLLPRIAKLREKEASRHDKRMEHIKAKSDGAK